MDTTEFTRDLTSEAEAGLIEPPIGRDAELRFIFEVLNLDGKANVLIKGPAGCGKTAIAEGVAYHMVNNSEYRSHRKKRLVALDLTALNAGATYVGQFEERVTKFLNQAKSDEALVVFIDEIHMLMGFGKASSSGASRDLSQIIKPALARGELSCIGATTHEEFERDIAPDEAFVRRFTELSVTPPGAEAVHQILKRISVKAKYSNHIEFTERTLGAVISASEAKWPRRFQPDKAIDLLKLVIRAEDTGSGAPVKGRKARSMAEYIKHVSSELACIQRNDLEELKGLAEQWLEVRDNVGRTVDLGEPELLHLLENNM
jgi:ATP-dependent Clp protease ATP-binding subunit ClpA